MRTYRQYCPIARAAEILAEPWTPVILRNVLGGADTFAALLAGAPGLSRSTLTRRLDDLQRSGIVTITAKADGHGHHYRPTDAGAALAPVLQGMGTWAEAHLGLDPTNSDPGFLLHNWASRYLDRDKLPATRIVVRFDFVDQPAAQRRMWLVFDHHDAEVCVNHPGGEEDLVVTTPATAVAEWHLGRVEWSSLLRSGRLTVQGPPALARALPTWNQRSPWAHHANDRPTADPVRD